MTAWITTALIVVGAFFSLVAALGILRMPDLLMRMHAGTKAGTLGAGLLLLAAAVALGEMGAVVRAGAAIVFLLLTAPVAAHLIGRAAYRSGQLRLWERTRVDELREHVEGREHAADPGAASPTRLEPPVPERVVAGAVVTPGEANVMNTTPQTRG
jgi:multicomponent Na+:H+ antiporter subunit G